MDKFSLNPRGRCLTSSGLSYASVPNVPEQRVHAGGLLLSVLSFVTVKSNQDNVKTQIIDAGRQRSPGVRGIQGS